MYFIHFVVSLLSQLNISWAWLTNAPMPQPLSVFDCEVKAKFTVKRPLCRLHSMSRDGMSKDVAYARNTESGYNEKSGPRL